MRVRIRDIIKSDPLFDYITINDGIGPEDLILKTPKKDYLIQDDELFIRMNAYIEIVDPTNG